MTDEDWGIWMTTEPQGQFKGRWRSWFFPLVGNTAEEGGRMRTYIDAPDGWYWGLTEQDWLSWVRYCDKISRRLELAGITNYGELYYQMFEDSPAE